MTSEGQTTDGSYAPSVRAFLHQDGSVGIRDHLFVLPTVVCANQVAINVARRHPQVKYIEHQHGCAQIGADFIQTSRVFTRLASHPNVFATAFVGLGCEAILSRDLFRHTTGQSQNAMELFIIQELGNTDNTASSVEEWLAAQEVKRAALTRSAVSATEIRVGLILDDDSWTQTIAWKKLMQALMNLGVALVVPEALRAATSDGMLAEVEYGERATDRYTVMRGGSNLLEIATGLSASGAHLILHLANKQHAFGSPVVPMPRFAIDPEIYSRSADDFDGAIGDVSDVEAAIRYLVQVMEGRESVTEEMGLDDFAMYRIGPTV